MELRDIYNLLEEHLENEKRESCGKMKRVKLPIPKEYGGGWATGYGVEETVKNLIEKISGKIREKSDAPLFKDCYDKWILIKEGEKRSPSTIESYKGIARTHLLPFFGDKTIDKITADDIQIYFNSIMDLSRSYSTQSKTILTGIFDRAMRLGEVEKNPMQYQYERSRKEGKKVVLQDDRLIDAIDQIDKLKGKDYLYFCFLCYTSLRRGEILGLRWSDIDFDKREIHVRNNVTFPNGRNDSCVREPKDESYGVIHLNSALAERIRPMKRFGYILPYDSQHLNEPMTKSMFTKMWGRITKTIELEGATSHSFRASYVTMMNAHCDRVDPKALQGALRHKTPDLAIKVYTKENKDKTRMVEIEYDEYLCRTLEHKQEQKRKSCSD